MKPSEYIKKAVRTEAKEYKFGELNGVTPRIEHAVMGIVTEAGELMHDVKRAKVYNKKFEAEHLLENTGDLFWYIALLCDAMNVSFEELWEESIKKLEERFPEKKFDYKKENL